MSLDAKGKARSTSGRLPDLGEAPWGAWGADGRLDAG